MKVLFYGNCQVSTLGEYAKWFTEKHDVVIVTNYAELVRPDGLERSLRVAEGAEFVFYQPIDDKYGGFATTDESFFRSLPDVPRVSIPYIYNSALWPTYYYLHDWHEQAMLKRLLTTPSRAEAKRAYLRSELDFEYSRRWVQTTQRLSESEAVTDVRVSRFIAENFQQAKLFLTQNHPTSPIYAEMVRQVEREVPGLFPPASTILSLGDDVLPYNDFELNVDLSSYLHWGYEWTSAQEVLTGTQRFLDQWDSMVSGTHPAVRSGTTI